MTSRKRRLGGFALFDAAARPLPGGLPGRAMRRRTPAIRRRGSAPRTNCSNNVSREPRRVSAADVAPVARRGPRRRQSRKRVGY